MNKSEKIDLLAAALCKAQSEFKGAKKDSSNPFFKSKYADLESVWEAIREPLFKNGLAIVQGATFGPNGEPALYTMLIHTSGQWIEGTQALNSKANDPQAIGSATTYARRYGLAAILGIVQTDDDAESAMGRASPTSQKLPTVVLPSSASNSSELRREVVTAVGSNICCGKPMMVSKFDTNVLFCMECKKKIAKA